MTKSDRLIIGQIVSIGCLVCLRMGYPECAAEFHHIREGTGIGRKSDVRDGIGLCPRHHRFEEGIHTIGRKTWESKFGEVRFLLQWDREQRERP